jgi:Mn-dependent DtxR family transcriptional regulator
MNGMRFKKEIIEKIRKVLKERGELTLSKLSREIGISRLTLYKYVLKMQADGELETKRIGNYVIIKRR